MVLEVKHLSYAVDKRFLIEDISLVLQPGLVYGLLGPNGSGKSTLLKTMAGLLKPTCGQLAWQGKHLLNLSRLEISRTLSLVSQNPTLYFDFSVQQMVEMGLYARGESALKSQKQIEEIMIQVDIAHLRHRPLSQISGGERQRVYIGRALMTQAPILLLDEPFSHLDVRHQLEIWQVLRKLAETGKIVVVANHDLSASKRFCDQLILLHCGHCQAVGSYDSVVSPEQLASIFGVSFIWSDLGT